MGFMNILEVFQMPLSVAITIHLEDFHYSDLDQISFASA